MNALTWEADAVWRSVRRAVTEAGPERTTAVQSLKAAGAAVLAWALAGWWWGAPMAFLAPWTALFLMQSTVYRSLLSALQQLVVVVLGTLLAAAAGALTGNQMAAMALALPLTVLLGNYARFGTQGMYAPTAALFVLAYGSYSGHDIAHRLLETLLGAVIGIGVNALVLPPVHSRRVGQLRALVPRSSGELLHTAADGLAEDRAGEEARGWYDRAERLTDLVTDLREARRWSEESRRTNPALRLRRVSPPPPAHAWEFVWDRATDHIATTMRTLTEVAARPTLAPEVRDSLAAVLRAAGDVCLLDEHTPQAPPAAESDGAPAGDHRQALARAAAAHRHLTSVCAGRPLELTTGGLLADTRRLLAVLVWTADPEGAYDPEVPTRRHGAAAGGRLGGAGRGIRGA
ncbi:aromatic acid exporter family protein [Streptomyces sp. NPDC008313]|uniref:FUSC family protein n=1 Tax=Streptomyces sp. NPDC008313 TaxID=3364826 RepID=UPI0036E54187